MDGGRESEPLLIDDAEGERTPPTSTRTKSRTWYIRWTLAALSFALALGLLLTRLLRAPTVPDSTKLWSNGTHLFRRTVIMVSIDGLRADYLDRGFTPHLFDISQVGLRAEYMKPIFPTVTFPNHWTLLTGLYAESHGVVGNNFWDPELEEEFWYSDPNRSWNASWWKGEPIWEVLENKGVRTANLMWIGPPTTERGVSPNYFVPWKNHVSLSEKLDQIVNWIDLPLEERPQLIVAYEPSLDQAGHLDGPFSKLVNATLVDIDVFAKDLHTALARRNLSDIVDIIFVSDHGMADTSKVNWVYLEDFIGTQGCAEITHEDGWPSMGLRFSNESNVQRYIEQLQAAAARFPDKFDVFTPETMPKRYHFSKSIRIAPVYVIPKLGHALARERGTLPSYSHGNHGFDNEYPEMRAVFVADGPFVKRVKEKRSLAPHGVSWVLDGFANIEVKALIARLFDISLPSASHNGTQGFWDAYL